MEQDSARPPSIKSTFASSELHIHQQASQQSSSSYTIESVDSVLKVGPGERCAPMA